MIQENPMQCAKTFYNLLGHISKDQTIQYLLTLVDDFLQEEDDREFAMIADAINTQLSFDNFVPDPTEDDSGDEATQCLAEGSQ